MLGSFLTPTSREKKGEKLHAGGLNVALNHYSCRWPGEGIAGTLAVDRYIDLRVKADQSPTCQNMISS